MLLYLSIVIFGGGDGFGIIGNIDIGELELYAWKGPSVPIKDGDSSVIASTGDELDITVNTTLDDIFIRLWVLIGLNIYLLLSYCY